MNDIKKIMWTPRILEIKGLAGTGKSKMAELYANNFYHKENIFIIHNITKINFMSILKKNQHRHKIMIIDSISKEMKKEILLFEYLHLLNKEDTIIFTEYC